MIMKHFSVIFILCLIALSWTAPQGNERQAEILRLINDNNGLDRYSFAYDTSNGISRNEEGQLRTTDDGAAIVVHGSTSYTAPDGRRYEIVFSADENGYRPTLKLA